MEYEYSKLYIRHPKNLEKKEDIEYYKLYTRLVQDEKNISHASLQGWEIKATTLFNKDDTEVEVFHLQRSSLHPNFGKETFTDNYWKQSQKEKDEFIKNAMDTE